MADGDDARRCNGGTGSIAATSAGRMTLVEMAQARALPAQDGDLMAQGDEFELQ